MSRTYLHTHTEAGRLSGEGCLGLFPSGNDEARLSTLPFAVTPFRAMLHDILASMFLLLDVRERLWR